jgi:hypothetical protein
VNTTTRFIPYVGHEHTSVEIEGNIHISLSYTILYTFVKFADQNNCQNLLGHSSKFSWLKTIWREICLQ